MRAPREALGDGEERKRRPRPRAGPEGEARLRAVEGAGSSRTGGQGPTAQGRDAHAAQDGRAGDADRCTVARQDGVPEPAAAARGDAVAPEGRVGAWRARPRPRNRRGPSTSRPRRSASTGPATSSARRSSPKLQARLKRAEAKNKELQVRYGNRPAARRPRTAVY